MKNMLIVDNQELILKGVCSIVADLYKGIQIHEAISFDMALKIKNLKPWDLIILEAMMPNEDLIGTLRQIRQANRKAPILIMTSSTKTDFVSVAIGEGATGFIRKNQSVREILLAVETVLAGDVYIQAEIVAEMTAAKEGSEVANQNLVHHKLSARELEVFLLIAEGYSVKEIALALSLSEKTVATHLSRSREKTGLITYVEIARYAFRQGLVD